MTCSVAVLIVIELTGEGMSEVSIPLPGTGIAKTADAEKTIMAHVSAAVFSNVLVIL